MTIIIYGARLSPYVMRPILAARAKGHEIDCADFEGGLKSPAFLALSPMGKMPLMVDGDFALPESQPITDYLDRVLDGPKLAPEEPKEAARTRLIVRLADLYIVLHFRAMFEAREKPEGVPAAFAGLRDAVRYIEHFRRATDVHVVGDQFTVADAALIPLFFFFDMFAKQGQGDVLAETPGLAAWWARAKASDLGSRCVAEQGEGLKAMIASRG